MVDRILLKHFFRIVPNTDFIRTIDERLYIHPKIALEAMKDKNYTVQPNRWNIIGIRTIAEYKPTFDDTLFLIKVDNDGKYVTHKRYKITTDPGSVYFNSPVNKAGTAILKEGEYDNYSIDLHNNDHKALCQRRNGAVPVYRIPKGTKNFKMSELDKFPLSTANGINIHAPTDNDERLGTLRWSSAGCQVHSSDTNNQSMVLTLESEQAQYSNKYKYNLLNSKNLLKCFLTEYTNGRLKLQEIISQA